MSKTVIALFDSMGRAQSAVQALERTGFVNERIRVQTGEELVARAQAGGAPEEARGGVERFLQDIGLAAGGAGETASARPALSADDAVILLQTSDDRAERAAEVLDRHGAVDVDERRSREPKSASGVDAVVGSEPPPRLDDIDQYEDIDERTLVSGSGAGAEPVRGRPPRHARIYPGGDAPLPH
ncbi:hypothetical protein SVA_0830 [Sulfurifustis variabilis]|uniref:General stress protein 17M-like domain-containing protein n=1 Tax=Sulfurifustis variabilis TaxID=1675686 RepID=A0A1B4V1P5_9GAMM|nr:hypothetical protein [Sulfurifustis variabilis]BAU47409.1 hypothetical protein SVA_0830 [Sulfurifustis variabilis]